MVFSRELPDKPGDLYAEFVEIFFKYANTYTADSILHGYMESHKADPAKATPEELRMLGYDEKFILEYEMS